MNREIKFRVWDKLWKEMSYIDLCDLAEGDDYWYDGETSVWEVMNDATNEQRRYVIQQYTGLKDKNGKEIYEGDVLNNTAVNFKFIVKFENTKYILQKLEYPDDALDMNDYFHRIPTMFEVIGNIYEREKENVNTTN